MHFYVSNLKEDGGILMNLTVNLDLSLNSRLLSENQEPVVTS